MKSLQRKLDKHLVLVVNQKLGDKKYFLLPQSKREDGETLRQVIIHQYISFIIDLTRSVVDCRACYKTKLWQQPEGPNIWKCSNWLLQVQVSQKDY